MPEAVNDQAAGASSLQLQPHHCPPLLLHSFYPPPHLALSSVSSSIFTDYTTLRLPLSPSPVTMGGFDFSNYNRNNVLHAKGVPLPKATSTGTTIVGCVFDNGVVVR